MSINKVVYGNDTLIDLTEDTVAPENLLSGATAHNAAGNPITGTARQGHIIYGSSVLPMAGQPNLKFEGVKVENDDSNHATIIKPQFHVCATEAEWNQKTDAEKNDPLIYWVRPWANSDAFATDRTPVGTVISVGAAKTGEATGVSTPTGRFPTDDYLVCDGSTYITVDSKTIYICQQNFPKLYDYFVEAYGTATYFGSGRGQQGDFSLPDWSADFPENGVLCIKAQISSTVITFAEVDQSGIYAGEDKVPSCARVAEIEGEIENEKERIDGYSQSGNTKATLDSLISSLTVKQRAKAYVEINNSGMYCTNATNGNFQTFAFPGATTVMYYAYLYSYAGNYFRRYSKATDGTLTNVDETITSWKVYIYS